MKNILVLGAGALGGWISTYLAIDGRDDIHVTVVDFDVVAERNIIAGTQNFLRDQVGKPKTEALQFNIYKQYNRTINVVDGKLTTGNVDELFSGATTGMKYDLIVDAFDNFEARSAITEACKTIPCVHVGFSQTFTWSILWNDGYIVPEDPPKDFDVCEMAGSASFVRMVASVGSLVIQDFLKTGKKREFVGSKLSLREVL